MSPCGDAARYIQWPSDFDSVTAERLSCAANGAVTVRRQLRQLPSRPARDRCDAGVTDAPPWKTRPDIRPRPARRRRRRPEDGLTERRETLPLRANTPLYGLRRLPEQTDKAENFTGRVNWQNKLAAR